MFEKLSNLLGKETTPQELIHPQFTEKTDKFWMYNRTDYARWKIEQNEKTKEPGKGAIQGLPTLKIAFVFDDPKLLDDCPFVCKIGKNVDGDTKYFGVAYGDETIQKQMKEWAKKFRRATLLNESGDQILEEIKTEIHPDKK